MTPPRLVRPNVTYAISRLVLGQRFLLRPDGELNELFMWVLGIAAKRYGVEIHVVTVMSSHFHLVVTAPYENVSDFMHCLDMNLARAIQVLRKYDRTVVWTPGGPSILELETTEAVIEQLAYAIANPVKSGLVHQPSEWPGVTARVEDIGVATLEAKRPDYYFDRKNPRWDEEVSVALTMPPCLRDLPIEQAHARIASELDAQLERARAEVKLEGWTVLGAMRAQRVSFLRCAQGSLKRGKLNPHFAAGRGQREAREAAIERIRTFRAAYREAKKAWCAGDRDVIFPAGTYWMRVHHGANVAPFP